MWGSNLYTGDIAATQDGKYLWISNSENSRVLRVRDPLTNPTVDIVLGQPDLTANQCNQGFANPTAFTLCYPGHLSIDSSGNLFVSDHSLEARGNFRLLEYDASLFPEQPGAVIYDIAASRVFGTGGSFTTAKCKDATCAPWDPAFDLAGRMYLGFNGYLGTRFPLLYDSPLTNSSPTGALNDFFSMGFTAHVDRYNTLYIGDLNRGRVLVYYLDPPQPGYTVSGKLVNQGGYGLPNGAVQVENYVWNAAGDADGNFTVQDVTPGDYDFIPGQGECTFTPPQIALHVTGNMENQNFQAVCSYTITGKVMDGSTPLAGAVVADQTGNSATTGADGDYTLTGLPPDAYTLTVTKTGYTFIPASLSVNLTNQNLQNVDFSGELTRYYDLSGKVTEDGTTPLEGVLLTLAPDVTATTDANGDYLFSDLLPGSYTVTPAKAGYAFTPASQSVTVTHQSLQDVDFSGELTRYYDLSGKVTEDGTTPLEGVLLTLAPDVTTTTDANGDYLFSGLLPGSYTVTPAKAGYAFTPASQSVAVTHQSLQDVDFSGAILRYDLSGKVTDGSAPLAGVSLTLAPDVTTTTDANGDYLFPDLLPGSYIVTPSKPGYTFEPAFVSVAVIDQNLPSDRFHSRSISREPVPAGSDQVRPLGGNQLSSPRIWYTISLGPTRACVSGNCFGAFG